MIISADFHLETDGGILHLESAPSQFLVENSLHIIKNDSLLYSTQDVFVPVSHLIKVIEYMCHNRMWNCTVLVLFEILMKMCTHYSYGKCRRHLKNDQYLQLFLFEICVHIFIVMYTMLKCCFQTFPYFCHDYLGYLI